MSKPAPQLRDATDGSQTGITRESIGLLPRLQRLREAVLAAPYGLCTQKAELITEAMRAEAPQPGLTKRLAPVHLDATRSTLEDSLSTGAPAKRWQLEISKRLQTLWIKLDERSARQPTIVSLAKALGHTLAAMELKIYPDELLAGSPTRHRVGAAFHPDYGGQLLLPELGDLDKRPINPLVTTPGQIHALEQDILPYWFTRSVMSRGPVYAEDLELQNKLTEGRRFVLTQFAGISHVTPDFPTVLEIGFVGIRQHLREAAARAVTDEQRAFCEAGELVATAVIEFGARWSLRCKEEADRVRAEDPARAAELEVMADNCARVPAHGARTFHEALQSVITTWVAIHQESFQHGVSFGRVDQYLWPFYEADVAAGRLDRDGAVELLGCFLAKAAEQLPLFNGLATEFFSGLSSASGLTLGGCDAKGEDASNELSFLTILAYDRMRLRQPNLHLRVGPYTPLDLRLLAAEVIGGGGGQPALFNDAQVIPAMLELGVPETDARDVSIVGCVEWGVPYQSFPAAGAGFVSLPAVLDEVLHGRLAEGEGPESIGAVWQAFEARLAETLDEVVAGNDAIEHAHAQWRPTPLLSLTVRGCIEARCDVTGGGSHYDSSGIQGVGLADLADSFAALEAMIFAEPSPGAGVTFAGLMEAVDADFEGHQHEMLRRRIVDTLPRYGQDQGRPEYWAARAAKTYARLLRAHRHPRRGTYAPGFWSMTNHVGFGARLGALPSGRKAKRPFANGASPTNGADDRGPTASLLSVAKVGGPHVANGLALNESLDPSFAAGPEGAPIIDALTQGYFDAGGMQVQYNVIDVETLLDAKRYPERHRGLVVRISGYSAYFNDLTPAMKDEIIARSLHGRASVFDDPSLGPACQIVPPLASRDHEDEVSR